MDATPAEGVSNLKYAAPNLRVELRKRAGFPRWPVLWWRSVEHTHTAFAKEVVADMLAEAAGGGSVGVSVAAFAGASAAFGGFCARSAGVVRLGTGGAPAGRFRGLAVHESFGSFVAEVAEVSLTSAGAVKLERMYCAVDCGVAVNPDIIRAQMEGGIGYGLGAAMRNQITLREGGEVEQTNFPNYEPLRIGDMPEVEVAIVKSDEVAPAESASREPPRRRPPWQTPSTRQPESASTNFRSPPTA